MPLSFNRAAEVLATASFIVGAIASPFVTDSRRNVSYQGITTSPGIETFLGLPYGKDTSGDRRFAPPEPFAPPSGYVFNATAAGPSCPQASGGGFLFETNVTYISENCLNLLLSRPSNISHGTKLPVMAYIYGGGLNSGTAYARTNQPDGLIQQSIENGYPVIYVAMNYRLNIFGFATSDALRGNKSLNVGLRDQRLALEWVKDNVHLFGGDPNNVTIFGQSSGGLSVEMQVLAYGSEKPVPFQGAIMQSTALEPTMASNISFNATSAIAVAAGCNATDAFSTSPSMIDCLRSLPMEKLLNLTLDFIDETSANNDGDIFLPTVDQDFLPDLSSKLVAEGKFPKIKIMTGWMENDATLFTNSAIKTPNDTRSFFELYYPGLNSTTLTNLLSLYPVSDFSPNTTANLSAEFYRSAEIFRDILLTCPSFYFASAMAKKYPNSTEPPVYLYSGNQTILGNYLNSTGLPGLGVIHTSELSYLYGNLSIFNVTDAGLPGYHFDPSASDYELARQLPRSWSSFAATGKPSLVGKDTLPGWTSAYPDGKGEGIVYVIGGAEEGMAAANQGIMKERLRERCGFLNSAEVIEQLQY
ncbi:alpha/beta-hydrolase [Mollisia scopiformis]|uniref:Carboxylic ester hydrolase n=1 Tax=Mollisia scopiformis TaxID=149040 RepID=A0A132BAJ2_MOLSC|nr:alpha/beta-hydrolase [Mollisia scopiformis]KUJ09406.1 alpha/beta-hydrolase [Mollisia scopiformis]